MSLSKGRVDSHQNQLYIFENGHTTGAVPDLCWWRSDLTGPAHRLFPFETLLMSLDSQIFTQGLQLQHADLLSFIVAEKAFCVNAKQEGYKNTQCLPLLCFLYAFIV